MVAGASLTGKTERTYPGRKINNVSYSGKATVVMSRVDAFWRLKTEEAQL